MKAERFWASRLTGAGTNIWSDFPTPFYGKMINWASPSSARLVSGELTLEKSSPPTAVFTAEPEAYSNRSVSILPRADPRNRLRNSESWRAEPTGQPPHYTSRS